MRFGLLLSAIALALPASLFAAPTPSPSTEKAKSIDVVICLDTSNSMDGLIDSAKRKLWAIVNDLAKIEPTPVLRVGLYSYGNNDYDPKKGWVRKDVDLTNDLDEVYKQLNSLRTNGGEEYVARVTRDAMADLKWSEGKDSLHHLRLRQRAGRSGQRSHARLRSRPRQTKGVVINTIYCGPANHVETTG